MKDAAVGDNIVDFEYKPESTVNNIREFAAEKLKCQHTALIVRKRGQGNALPTTKSLLQCGINPEDILVVNIKIYSNVERAAKRIITGKGKIVPNMISPKF